MSDIPTPRDPGPAGGEFEILSTEIKEISTGSLYVNVDYNDLAASVGHDEALKILNELRALLT